MIVVARLISILLSWRLGNPRDAPTVSVLFGHPAGNPNALHAALAHFESGRLDAFCVPWMPSAGSLQVLQMVPGLSAMAGRLARRRFPPLVNTPLVQGRLGEWRRLVLRALGRGDEALSYEANDWLMRTMVRECHRPGVTAVHAYEDCALWQFQEAKQLGKSCIYDMPIGYYPAWEETQRELARRYADWLPQGGLPSNRFVRPEQKRREMELADLVLVPSDFVAETIRRFHPDQTVSVASYGVDSEEWRPPVRNRRADDLTFLFAGQCSLRKGTPLLLGAWRAAALPDAKLMMVGPWLLAEAKRPGLDPTATWIPPQPRNILRSHYQAADVFVLPSFFEGRALVVGEAMASGLPILTTFASGAVDLVSDMTGRLFPVGDLDALVAALRWFSEHRDDLPAMRAAARAAAERCTWSDYRRRVAEAVAPFA